MKFNRILTVLALTATLAAFAQVNIIEEKSGDGPYISLGLTYRNFDKPKFKSAGVSGSEGFYISRDGIGAIQPITNISNVGRDGSVHGATQTGHAEVVTIVTSEGGYYSSKGSLGTADKLAPVIGIGFPLTRKDALSLDLVGNFAYFTTDSASRDVKSYGFGQSSYQALVQNGVVGYYDGEVVDNLNVFGGGFKAKYEMKLYQFDLGANLGFSFQNGLQLNIAAGPSFALADIDSTGYSAYNGVSGKRHDDASKSIFGVYASAGVSYWFTEHLGLSCDVRYDEAFKDAKTKFVTQDLDTWSAGVRVLWHF
jgi:opacity protein-like surface antigen